MRFGWMIALGSGLVSIACATSTSREPFGPGSGGDGGGSASSSASESASSSSGAGGCIYSTDCPPLDDPCVEPVCINAVCSTQPTNDLGPCDDGDWCTEGDTCQAGVCTGGSQKFCPSPDPCHIGVCDPAAMGCAAAPGNDGAQCDDGDACTTNGTCSNGTCSKGPPIDCSFLDGTCTVGTCDSQLGCQPMPVNDGTPCDDNLFCTIGDTCSGGTCSGSPNPCAPPSNTCLIGVCNENAKSCVTTPAKDGLPCDDGNDCTILETCSSGMCLGGVAGNEGAACDDHDGCTQGTSCANGNCKNPSSTITQCVMNDSCCPMGCALQMDNDCLFWASGVQKDVPNGALIGWEQCWLGTYGSGPNDSPNLKTLLNQCNKANLLMACRKVGAQSWSLAAMAPRADVLFDCGSQSNCTKQSNGVGWYYSDSYSWGFAPGGATVSRNSCDFLGQPEPNDADLRLCWHTGGGTMNTGFRCGDNSQEPSFWLNDNTQWERALFQAD